MNKNGLEELRKLYLNRLSLNYGDDPSKETEEYWDSKAEAYSEKAHSPSERAEVEKILNRFSWTRGERVFDVATGPGTYAIPLALRGCEVVALDFSKEMLKQLRLQAEKENVNTKAIETILGHWLEVNLQGQVNTVICMSGLGVIATDNDNHSTQLGEALEKLKSHAKKRLIILIPHADSILDNEMIKILGNYEIPMERLRIALIYQTMIEHGMLPSVEIIEKPTKMFFKDVEEACQVIFEKSGNKEVPAQIKERFMAYLSRIMKKENELYCLNTILKQALFCVGFTN